MQADAYLITTLDIGAVAEDQAVAGSLANRITTSQDAQWTERLDASGDLAESALSVLLCPTHAGTGALHRGEQG